MRRIIRDKWPGLDVCIDSKETKQRLDKMLRFIVDNHLPISTPQMFLGDRRLCDEDTDMGLAYTMKRLRPRVEVEMKKGGIIALVAGCVLLGVAALTVQSSVHAAAIRLKTGIAEAKPKVAIANDAEAKYCTPAFKQVPSGSSTRAAWSAPSRGAAASRRT